MPRLLLCFVLLLLTTASRLHAESGPHWLQVKTEHFTVYTDGSDHQARQISAQLERMQGLFAKLLPHATTDTGSRILVLALKNRKDFQMVQPADSLAKGSLDLAGLFLQRQDRSYILLRLDTEGEHPYAIVYHEYTHYMVRHIEALPLWLNEGLAQFYQNTDLDEKTARFGQPAANEIRYLREQKLIPLPTLFAVDHNSPFYHEQDKGNVFYAESWALTHMLFLRDFRNHASHLSEYVAALEKREDAVAAAQKSFGDLKQLQKDLDTYVHGGNFDLLQMPLQNAVTEASFTVEPIATADADAVRADVLIENGRKADGLQLIEAVLQQAPANAQAHESMGLLKLREGDMREARKWYGEAVALHSTSYLAYYYFGSLSLQLGKGGADALADDSVGASLQEAVKLNPRFAPALDALAHFDAVHEQTDEAVQMELRAVGEDPKNVFYRLNAAQIRVQRKDYDAAISILQATLPIAQTPEDRERVHSRLESLRQYVASVKENANRAGPAAKMVEVHESGTATGPVHGAGADPHSGPAPDPMVTDKAGRPLTKLTRMIDSPNLPTGPPSGPHRKVAGVLGNIGCFYPKGLLLNVNVSGKSLTLYSNDMYSIPFTAVNFTPKRELNPCQEFEGMKASVVYAAVTDQPVAGQIVSMELSK